MRGRNRFTNTEKRLVDTKGLGEARVNWEIRTDTYTLTCVKETAQEMATQCSCLENPRDGGAWWAAVYGVTQS